MKGLKLGGIFHVLYFRWYILRDFDGKIYPPKYTSGGVKIMGYNYTGKIHPQNYTSWGVKIRGYNYTGKIYPPKYTSRGVENIPLN